MPSSYLHSYLSWYSIFLTRIDFSQLTQYLNSSWILIWDWFRGRVALVGWLVRTSARFGVWLVLGEYLWLD